MKNYGLLMKCAIYFGIIVAILGLIGTAVCAILHYGRIVYLRPYMPMTILAFFGGIIISLLGVIGEKVGDKKE